MKGSDDLNQWLERWQAKKTPGGGVAASEEEAIAALFELEGIIRRTRLDGIR